MGLATVRPRADQPTNEHTLFWNARLQQVLHDLRTPLTVVLGYAELLQGGNPRADQVNGLDTILTAGWDLKSRIDDLVAESTIHEMQYGFAGLSAVDLHAAESGAEADLLGIHAVNFAHVKAGRPHRRRIKLQSTEPVPPANHDARR